MMPCIGDSAAATVWTHVWSQRYGLSWRWSCCQTSKFQMMKLCVNRSIAPVRASTLILRATVSGDNNMLPESSSIRPIFYG